MPAHTALAEARDPSHRPPAMGLHRLAPDRPAADDFSALRSACRRSGGIARGDDLARLLQDHHCQDLIDLARLIASGEVFALRWHFELWVPMFQFELADLSVKPGPGQVRAELAAAFEGWALVAWFVRGNTWLAGCRPVDLLDSDLPAVLQAARADRFVVTG